MSTSSSSLASSAQEVVHPREISHHHECVELLIPEHITNSLVISTVLEEMPLQARTTHQPVILTHAPDRSITKQNETGTSGKT
ncbi:hypothetical protein WUBG_04625 [Wuchereria bancrofti]|nr:hypothetical protein WUBG_04625 [Wuchereria bancrofti]